MPPKTRRTKQPPLISPPSYGPKLQRKYSPNKKAHYILDTETGYIEWEQKSKSHTDSTTDSTTNSSIFKVSKSSNKESSDPDKIIADFEKEENKKEKQVNANIKRRETKRKQKEKKAAQNATKRTAYFLKKEAQRKKTTDPIPYFYSNINCIHEEA